MTKPKETKESQRESFIKAARELGCDEDEAHFEEKLKKIARQKPPPESKPEKSEKDKPAK